ncbi:MAG: small subunit ribosomal protein S20 [Acidimicrobiales bacterium]|jgi:small subunit ribosomal protein S20
MANIKSAVKRARQNEKRALANKGVRTRMRTYTKKALESAGSDSSAEDLRVAIRHIDKAANKGIIHKNTASRKKSRLTNRVNAAK